MILYELLIPLVRFLFVIIAGFTVWDYFKTRDQIRWDIAMMFLAVTIVVLALTSNPPITGNLVKTVLLSAIMVQPYLLLRAAKHFQSIPSWIERFSLVSIVGITPLVIIFPIPSPLWLTLAGSIYFFFVLAYASTAFFKGGFGTNGVTSWRLKLAATGSAMFGLLMLVITLLGLFPAWETILVPIGFLALTLMPIAYYLGLAPPRSLRHYWQQLELERYLHAAAQLPLAKRADGISQLLCDAAVRTIGGQTAFIAWWQPESQKLRLEAAPTEPSSIVLEDPQLLAIVKDSRAQIIMASSKLSPQLLTWLQQFECQAMMVVPITAAERCWGLLLLFLGQPSFFTDDDLSLLSLFTEQSVQALSYEALFVEQQRSEARALALAHTAIRLNEKISLQDAIDTICSETKQALPVTFVTVSLYNPQRQTLYFAGGLGLPPHFPTAVQELPKELYDKYVTQNKIVVTPDVQSLPNLPNAALYQEMNLRTTANVSMMREGQLLGRLNVGVMAEVYHFSEDELALLGGLAAQGAMAIAKANLYEEAQKELAEKKQAKAELEAERAHLAARVEERTAELKSANQKLAKAAKAKDEFLATMSHELRTPLNAIFTKSEMILEGFYGELNEKQINAFDVITESSQHLLELINDILDIAKIEAGKLKIERAPVSVKSICESSLRLVKGQAHHKNIALETTGANKHIRLNADARRLKQILVNLLSNAIKFTHPGNTVGLDVTPLPEEGTIQFTVWDTGIGMSPQELDRLLGKNFSPQPFVQLDSALSRQYEGTGLGLSLVYHLTKLHGGNVTVVSNKGKGSHFTVSLPFKPINKQAIKVAKPVQYNQTPHLNLTVPTNK